jgi:outer membrane protein OmpA-like peptidoglycan-associated protein
MEVIIVTLFKNENIMMEKIFIIISLFLIVSSAIAQERDIGITLSGKELIETEPRKMVNTTFLVTNNSSVKQEFTSYVRLPKGWNLLIENLPFEIEANKSDVRIVSFLVPREAMAGKYEVTYQVRARNSSASSYCTLYVVVLPITSIQVNFLKAPEYTIAGNTYQALFSVANESNTKKSIIIEVNSSDNQLFTVDAEKLELASGESKTVTVTVNTDEKLRTPIRHQIDLNAQAADEKNEKIQAMSSVDIIPRISGDGELYYRIPAQITVSSYLSQKENENNYGFQGEFSGGGALNEAKDKNVSFLFRGPNSRNKSAFGEYDEYRFNLWAKNYKLGVGDNFYSLSPLTENYSYGRGAVGELGIDKVKFGAYYQQSRWFTPEQKSMAGYVNYNTSDKYKLSINYLRETDVSDFELKKKGISDFGIASLYGIFKLIKDTNIELECASGNADYAYLMKLYGYNSRISYFAQLLHAGPDYPGYYRDKDSITANVAVPIIKKLRLNAGFQQGKYNLDLDPTLFSAYLERFYRSGLNYNFLAGTSLSLDFTKHESRDRFPQPSINYDETTYRAEVGQQFKKINLDASAEFGQSKDNLTGKTARLELYNFFVYFMPTIKQSYNAYVNYRKNVDFIEKERDSVIAGIDTSFHIGEKTYFKTSIRTKEYRYIDHNYRVSNIDLRLIQTLWSKHKIMARGRYTTSGKQNASEFMVEYTVPLKLPVSRKKNIGVVKGHIYNEESKAPVQDVILVLGKSTAVTDKNGNFEFPSLKAGNYKLYINQSSIAVGFAVVQPTPIDIVVTKEKEFSIEIGVSRSATVYGKIMVYDFDNADRKGYLKTLQNGDGEIVQSRGSTNTLLELINDKGMLRQVTDRDGTFSFEGLHPGKWTLKINDGDLPENHYIDKNTYEYHLKPGEKTEVSIKVLPRIRHMRMLEEGGKVNIDSATQQKAVISKKVVAKPEENKNIDKGIPIEAAITKKTENTVKDIADSGVGKYMDNQAKEMQKEITGAKVDVVGQGEESKINLTFDSGFLFDKSKADLNLYTIINLNKFAGIIQKYPNTNILVEGHTDSTGADDLNMELSKKRANAIVNYLIQQKVDSNRMTVRWYGKTKPIANNETEEGRQQNRRVEITITPNDKMKQDSAIDSKSFGSMK